MASERLFPLGAEDITIATSAQIASLTSLRAMVCWGGTFVSTESGLPEGPISRGTERGAAFIFLIMRKFAQGQPLHLGSVRPKELVTLK
jgi:hypothetical protein